MKKTYRLRSNSEPPEIGQVSRTRREAKRAGSTTPIKKKSYTGPGQPSKKASLSQDVLTSPRTTPSKDLYYRGPGRPRKENSMKKGVFISDKTSPTKKHRGPGRPPKKNSIKELVSISDETTSPKQHCGCESPRKETSSSEDKLTSNNATASENQSTSGRQANKAFTNEDVMTPVKEVPVEEVEISNNNASSTTLKLQRKKQIPETVSQPLLDNTTLKHGEDSQKLALKRKHEISEETTQNPTNNIYRLREKVKGSLTVGKITRAEDSDNQEMCVHKLIGAMDISEDNSTAECNTCSVSELQSSDLPIAGYSYQADLTASESEEQCEGTASDINYRDLEKNLEAMFREDSFGVDSPRRSTDVVSSSFENASPDLEFGVRSPNAGNISSAEITLNSQETMTSPGCIRVSSVGGSLLESLAEIHQELVTHQEETGEEVVALNVNPAEKENKQPDEMIDLGHKSSENTSSFIRELEMSSSDFPGTSHTGRSSPQTGSPEILENCKDDSAATSENTHEKLRSVSDHTTQLQTPSQGHDETRKDHTSQNSDKQAVSQDETTLQGRVDAEGQKIPNGVLEETGERPSREKNSASNREEPAIDKDCVTLSPDKRVRERTPLTPNSTSPSLIGKSPPQEISTRRGKRTLLDFSSSQSKRRKWVEAVPSVSSTGIPSVTQPSTSSVSTTSKEKGILDTNLQDRPEEGGSCDEMEMREDLNGNLVSRIITDTVILIDVIPNLEDLIRKGSQNLLKGFCMDGCKMLTNFSAQMWRTNDTEVSRPFCKRCMDSGIEKPTAIDYWFSAKFKIVANDSTIEVIFSGLYGAKFLGCAKEGYVSRKDARKEAHLRLRRLIKDKKPFDLSYLRVKTISGEHLRAV